ncbi:MAG: 1-acyl-sn-glycerol-3-phosphate acyltransferase [Gammaproteobacteria bacterium]|nr:1-acyl-sn-glycerol-3-phosphate acyltransferase [Gammaproteobacteria bacterium]
MSFNQIKQAIYALYLTNKFGFRLRHIHDSAEMSRLRLEYAETLMQRLNIAVEVENTEKLEKGGQYLMVSNHRSIIDPLIIEIALQHMGVHGSWIAKKELYNSFFFGMFTRNAGTVLLDREAKQMGSFFKEIKASVAEGNSIFVFPEGTRNKTDQPLAEFKDGSQIIAMKNRLPILPVYIKSNANEALMNSLKNNAKGQKVVIEIGDIIDYRDRSRTLEEAYRQTFNIG